MNETILKVPYAIDLGNGFAKRMFQNDTVLTEPSVFAEAPSFFSVSSDLDTLSFQDNTHYYVGKDATKSKLPLISALGDDDLERYDTLEFKKLLFGFMAKDLKEDCIVPHLIVGLPVNHFKAKSSILKEILIGKKVITVNEKDIVIEVKKVHVLPQPIGTYMNMVQGGIIDTDQDSTLIIDGGYGTVDITEMSGQTINNKAGAEIGVRLAHIEILNYLIDTFGEHRSLNLSNMSNVMGNGFKVDKELITINELEPVKRILSKHFDNVFSFIRQNRFDLKDYDHVVFTGGMALLHEELIKDKKRNNFIVLKNAQEANVRGYYEFGKAVILNEKNSSLR